MLHPNFRTDYDHYQGSPLALKLFQKVIRENVDERQRLHWLALV
jgi:hypothetical protein